MRNRSLFLFGFGLATLLMVVNGVIEDDHKKLLEWKPPKEMKKMYPYFLSGYDNDGTPISVFEFGRWDVRATMEKGPDSQEVKDFQNYTLQMYTWMYETPEIYKTGTNDYIIIADLEGYDNRHFTHPPSLAKILEMAGHFVKANRSKTDRIKEIFLLNCNYLFTSAYQLVKPILGKLGDKIELYGTNKEKWLPLLRKTIPTSQLPEFFGGDKDWKPVTVFG